MKPQLGCTHPPNGVVYSNSNTGECDRDESSQRTILTPAYYNTGITQSNPNEKPVCVSNLVSANSCEQHYSGFSSATKPLCHRPESLPHYQYAPMYSSTNS